MGSWLTELGQGGWVSTWVAPVFLLGFLIFIHELGHFLFAKAFGVPVEQFSFGFGPRLFGLRVGETDYRLNLIPLGGYVKMAGDDPFEEDDQRRSDGFLAQPPWKRLFIVGAGPAFNLALPVALFASVYMAGSPEIVAWIGTVERGSAGASADLRPGDEIVSVAGTPVQFWTEVEATLAGKTGEVALGVRRDGAVREVRLPLREGEEGAVGRLALSPEASLPYIAVIPGSPAEAAGLKSGDLISEIGGVEVKWWYEVSQRLQAEAAPTLKVLRARPREEGGAKAEPETVTVQLRDGVMALGWAGGEVPAFLDAAEGEYRPGATMLDVQPGMRFGVVPWELALSDVKLDRPAGRVGIKAGDVVVGLNGAPISGWSEIKATIGHTDGGEVELFVLRDRSLTAFRLKPELFTQVTPDGRTVQTAVVGITSSVRSSARQAPMHLGVFPAVGKGLQETGEAIASTVRVISRIVTGDIAVEDSLGGPIAIVMVAQQTAAVSIFWYFKIMAQISISLGLINLLPIPLLDGGHLIFFSVEAARGRPVSLRFREISHQVGLIFLLTLIAFALINDTRLHLLN